MKTKIATIIIALACISNVRAHLIDLTPGGLLSGEPNAAYDNFSSRQSRGVLLFFDSIWAIPYTILGTTYPPGWVSQFGVLNGGVYFFSNIDVTGPVSETTISWNFTGNSTYWLSDIYLSGLPGDPAIVHLYHVSRNERLLGEGSITLDGIIPIGQIGFYGISQSFVPDSGTTFLLFGLAVACIFCTRFWRQTG